MDRAEFDRVADEYEQQHARNVRLSGERPEYFARHKVQEVARQLGPARAPRVLDFGGGIGNSLPHLHELLAPVRLVCLDMSTRCLDIARQRFGPMAEYEAYDGQRLAHADGSFDLCFAACVFHHIEPAQRAAQLSELHRVSAPGGWLFIFEHNPFNPLTRHAVSTCEFDANAQLIRAAALRKLVAAAGFQAVRSRYVLFFPRPLAALRAWEPHLHALPLGAQYVVCARR